MLDGWTDGGKAGWNKWKKSTLLHSFPFCLIGALISHTPALNGDAGRRNMVEGNSYRNNYHEFCSN